MADEVERKFLTTDSRWKAGATGVRIRQGYLSTVPERTVRVRTEGPRAVLTVKGRTVGVSRQEYEYGIPFADAERMLDELCERPLIDKTRYRVRHGSHTWEVDEFHGDNAGLVVAALELGRPEEPFERPSRRGPEGSGDPRYIKAN
ncbi:MAG: CYTH domain-containing protein, partial [Vicinamibacterales bacterium]